MPSSAPVFATPLTKIFKINHPVMLAELIDVIIKGGASLFVCAVGVPPKWVVNKLHDTGIPVMKTPQGTIFSSSWMIFISDVSHVAKALAQGVDIICAQGGEGGGHTGDTPFSILIPATVDLARTQRVPSLASLLLS
ncbi:hypothetical protein K443DRAFT_3080 [Laccaria amethystina LaAM-08-1]|uniref:Nitronate monooxygenase n=1 Tax=Laccaria amethystina LaAM-08-1 TaxID=1095629 RepID=A0A0C9Y8R7_9AGAR|nr:hypothetical protein K443DRAFT_3080 [Laccaria amethystina LaAM-08-1]